MTKKLTRKKNKNVKKVGGGDKTDNISNTLLINNIISYLPSTETIKSESKIRDYLSSVDAITLLEIIGSDDKYMSSKSLNYLLESIDKNTLDIIQNMGSAINIPSIRKDIEMFEVDCIRLSKKTSVKELLELPNYLLDCNSELCNRNLNWYDIILGFRKLDNEYEELVKNEIFRKKIIINTNKTLTARDKLRENERVREIMKRRLLKCCQDPRTFFDKLKGTIAWVDYNHCTSCPNDDCILYLDENYKSFLMMDLNISSVKKLKILIFLEIRIYLLSKYIFIESLRLNKNRKRKIKVLVEKIYKNDYSNGRLISNKDNKIHGGAEDVSTSVPLGNSELSGNPQEPMKDISVNPELKGPMNEKMEDKSPNNLEDSLETSTKEKNPAEPNPAEPNPAEPNPAEPNPAEPNPDDISTVDKDSELLKQMADKKNEESPLVNEEELQSEIKDEDNEDEEEDEELVIYLTYNTLQDIDNMDNLKKLLINSMKRITHISNISNIMIGNPNGTDHGFRKGFCSYCFEVTINKPNETDESFEIIKENISDSINDGSFEEIMNVMKNKITLRDVYFKDLNKYFQNSRLRFKRGLAEIKLGYPQGGQQEKFRFSRRVKTIIYDSINSLFDEINLNKNRVQLELISAVDGDENIVLVQFMIMDSYSKLESSYSIAKTISLNLSRLKNNMIEEVNMLDKCYIFDIDTECNASKKKLLDNGVKRVGKQKDDIIIVNNNCNEIIGNLRKNYVSNTHLSENCSDAINKELGINN